MILESRQRPSVYLLWTARSITIAFALFISIFALDVFEENRGFWLTTGALLIHLIPTFLVLLILWLSWNRSWIASVFYLALAISYIIWAYGRFTFSTYLFISGPLLLVSALFTLGWWEKKKEEKWKMENRES